MPGVCTSVVALLGCAGDLSLTDPTLAPGTSVAKFCAAECAADHAVTQQLIRLHSGGVQFRKRVRPSAPGHVQHEASGVFGAAPLAKIGVLHS